MAIALSPAGTKEKVAQRRAKVLELRIAGYSHSQVAKLAGCCQRTAWNDLQHCMAELVKRQTVNAEHLRAIELERLDIAMNAIADKVKAGDVWCIDRWLRISESRRRLLGLDAQAGGGNVSIGGITINIAELPVPKPVESKVIEDDTRHPELESAAEASGVPTLPLA